MSLKNGMDGSPVLVVPIGLIGKNHTGKERVYKRNAWESMFTRISFVISFFGCMITITYQPNTDTNTGLPSVPVGIPP